MLGDELGTAIGFIVPSLMVGDDPNDLETVQTGLFRLSLIVAVVASINSLLILIFFDEQPAYAPGLGRLKQIEHQELEADEQKKGPLKQRQYKPLRGLGDLITDKNFINLLCCFGLNLGTNYSLHTVLNQMLLSPFIIMTNDGQQKFTSSSPNNSCYVGTMSSEIDLQIDHHSVGDAGLLLILSGLSGLIFFGYLMDRMHKYKLITAACSALSFVWMLIYTGGLYFKNELIIYILSITLGFFITAYSGCGFEYATELTYPKSEVLVTALLNMAALIFGIPITFCASYLTDYHGSLWAGLFLAFMLLIAFILNCIQSGELKRQKAIAS